MAFLLVFTLMLAPLILLLVSRRREDDMVDYPANARLHLSTMERTHAVPEDRC